MCYGHNCHAADVSDAEDVAAAVTSAERDEAHFEAVFEVMLYMYMYI